MMTKLITGKTDLKLGLPDSKAFNLFAICFHKIMIGKL